jgi:hypothetical protein
MALWTCLAYLHLLECCHMPNSTRPLCVCATDFAAVLYLQSLSFFTLADAWRSQPGSDVVTVAVGLLRQRTGALMRLLQGGHIQPEVRH